MVDCIHKVVDIRDEHTIEIQPEWDYQGKKGTTLIINQKDTPHLLQRLDEQTIMLNNPQLKEDTLHAQIIMLNSPQ